MTDSDESNGPLYAGDFPELVNRHRYPIWGKLVHDRVVELLDDEINQKGLISWIARNTSMTRSTVAKRISGQRPPPPDGERRRLNAALKLNKVGIRQLEIVVVADLCMYWTLKRRPIRKNSWREMKTRMSACFRFAEEIVGRTGELAAIYWLPLIMHQLESQAIRGGRLAFTKSQAMMVSIPPSACTPAAGSVQINGSTWIIAELRIPAEIQCLNQDGSLRQGAVDTIARHFEFTPGSRDRIGSDPVSGECTYQLTQDHAVLYFAAKEGMPVKAVWDGTVTQTYTATKRSDVIQDTWRTYAVDILHPAGYVIRYEGLSKAYVETEQAVKAGEVVGLAGKCSTRSQRVFKDGYPKEEFTRFATGVSISCHLSQAAYEEPDLREWILDPRICVPIGPTTSLAVSEDKVEVAKFLMFSRNDEAVQTTSLYDLLHTQSGRFFDFAQYLHEPYVIVPDGRLAGTLVLSALFLVTVPLAAWRLVRRSQK